MSYMPFDHVRMPDKLVEQRNGRLDPVDDELGQRPLQAHHALDACLAVNDQLADQAVVIGRYAIALIRTAVDADAQSRQADASM